MRSNQLRRTKKQHAMWGVFLFVAVGLTAVLAITAFLDSHRNLNVSFNSFPPVVFSAQGGTLFLEPASLVQDTDSQFLLDVKVDPGGTSVAAVVLNISFDPGILQLDAVDMTESAFSNTLIPAAIDNNRGTISITAGVAVGDPPAPVTDIAKIAMLKFHAIGESDSTLVSIESSSQAASIDEVGNVITSYIPADVRVSDTSDVTSPSDPSNLQTSVQSSGQIDLSWDASTDDTGVNRYEVERCEGVDCSDFSQVSSSNVNSYSDTGLTEDIVYGYRVRAEDAAGNMSGYSNIVSVKTQGGGGGVLGTIFEDDFESSLSWEKVGDVTWYTGSLKNDSHSVRIKDDGSYIEQSVSLDGFQNVSVSFVMGGSDLDNKQDAVEALYYDGNDWKELKTIRGKDADEDGKLHAYSVDLPSSVDGLSDFALRFVMNANGKNDYGFVDDVEVTGEGL